MRSLRLTVLVLLAALSACSDRSGCPQQPLDAVGLAEGQSGAAASLPSAQCELSEAERDQYYAARNRGLKAYCDAPDAFNKGLSGVAMDVEVCPLDLRKDVRSALRAGTEISKLEKRRTELLAEAAKLEQTAEGLEGEAGRALIDQANARRQDARQDENDLEALRGLATVQGWQTAPAAPRAATPDSD